MSAKLHESALLGLAALAIIIAAASLAQVGLISGQFSEQTKKVEQLSSQLSNLSSQLTALSKKPETGTRTIYVVLIPDVGGSGYDKFIPQEITVLKGEKVTLVLNNTDGDNDHGFAMDAYGIKKVVKSNTTVTIEFIADKAGIFDFHCIVYCGPGHPQMRGQLIVLG